MFDLSMSEAARVAGVSRSAIQHARRKGTIRSVRGTDGCWYFSRDDVLVYAGAAAARRAQVADRRVAARIDPSPRRTLSAEPLLRQVELRGGVTAGVGQNKRAQEALRAAKLYGRLTPRAADQIASALGMSVWEIWPT